MSKKSLFVVTSATPVTAETIEQALRNDHEFMTRPEYVRNGTLAMVPHMPAALAELVDRPVTTEAMLLAKFAVVRICLENGFVEKMVQNTPRQALARSGFTTGELAAKMRETMQMMLDNSSQIIADMVKAVKASGMNESELIQANPDLPEELKTADREGWLTVGKMLLLSPSSVIQND